MSSRAPPGVEDFDCSSKYPSHGTALQVESFPPNRPGWSRGSAITMLRECGLGVDGCFVEHSPATRPATESRDQDDQDIGGRAAHLWVEAYRLGAREHPIGIGPKLHDTVSQNSSTPAAVACRESTTPATRIASVAHIVASRCLSASLLRFGTCEVHSRLVFSACNPKAPASSLSVGGPRDEMPRTSSWYGRHEEQVAADNSGDDCLRTACAARLVQGVVVPWARRGGVCPSLIHLFILLLSEPSHLVALCVATAAPAIEARLGAGRYT